MRHGRDYLIRLRRVGLPDNRFHDDGGGVSGREGDREGYWDGGEYALLGACVGDGVGGCDDGGFGGLVARCFSRCQVLELGNNVLCRIPILRVIHPVFNRGGQPDPTPIGLDFSPWSLCGQVGWSVHDRGGAEVDHGRMGSTGDGSHTLFGRALTHCQGEGNEGNVVNRDVGQD